MTNFIHAELDLDSSDDFDAFDSEQHVYYVL